jgi:hypothetical protein
MYPKVFFSRYHQSFADVSLLSSYHAIRHHQLTSCGAWTLRCGSICHRASRSASVVTVSPSTFVSNSAKMHHQPMARIICTVIERLLLQAASIEPTIIMASNLKITRSFTLRLGRLTTPQPLADGTVKHRFNAGMLLISPLLYVCIIAPY